MIYLNTLIDPGYKILFLGCDSLVSHLASSIFQFASNKDGAKIIDSIRFMDSSRITEDDLLSHRCLPQDIGMFKAEHMCKMYAGPYPHVASSYSTASIPESIEASTLLKLFGSHDFRTTNGIVITCSTTPEPTIQSIKNLLESDFSDFNSVTHIHCELGTYDVRGFMYCARKYTDTFEVYYPETLPPRGAKGVACAEMHTQSIMGANVAFELLVNIFKFNKCFSDMKAFLFRKPIIGNFFTPEPYEEPVKLPDTDDGFYVLQVGIGGTGSTFFSDSCQLMSKIKHKIKKIAVVDGDLLEAHNTLNQKCLASESGTYKVHTMGGRLASAFPELNFVFDNNYLRGLSPEYVRKLFKLDTLENKNLIIVGCVDNFATRKLLTNFFVQENSLNNLIYIDSGNGTTKRIGQVVAGYKVKDKIISECIGTHPLSKESVWNDTEDISVIGTCAAESNDAPQNTATNKLASCLLLVHLTHIILQNKLYTNYCFFNADEATASLT